MKLEITPERAKDALIVHLKRDLAHTFDLVQWGSWTVAAEYAGRCKEASEAIRRLEMTPEKFEQQDLLDLVVPPPPRQAEIFSFSRDVIHSSAVGVQAASR